MSVAYPSSKGWLPSGPFAEWLRRQEVLPGQTQEWCEVHGITVGKFQALRNGQQKRVHIDTVDRVLLVADRERLDELYPFEGDEDG